ncbi:hypothetical protein [Shewanella surugensis]|uniref:Uncharacterized protein n=1 Tax=Shewanella surugensis TaxID=212020 RepID=A0ABT0LFQ3_9GAMM|nr:hypothetical protein [Shewanella surugensis]MCL1126509.1 hypothetical protein [Shewanella surugensis]
MYVNYGQYRLSNALTNITNHRLYYRFPDTLFQENLGHVLEGEFVIEGHTQTISGQEIRLRAGSQLTIKAGKTLTIATGSSFIIEDGAKLIVEDGAQITSSGTWSVANNAELHFGASTKITLSNGTWDIAENVTLDLATNANINVAKNATWQLGAGSQVLAAADVQLDIYGTLHAEGAEDNLVYFGSSQDAPDKGYWKGIKAYSNANITFKYAQVSHADIGLYAYLNGYSYSNNIAFNVSYSHFNNNTTAVNLSDVRTKHPSYNGATFAPVIQYSDFIDNDTHLYTYDNNAYQNTTVDARYNWWDATDFDAITAKLVYSENSATGMQVNLSPYRLSNAFNDYFDAFIDFEWPESTLINGEYVLDANYFVSSDITIADGQIVRVKSGRHLRLADGITLTIAVGGQLIIEDGAQLSLSDDVQVKVYGEWTLDAGAIVLSDLNAHIHVYGTLIGNGILDNEILFGSSLGDADGSLSRAEAGSWKGITAYSAATIQLRYTQIRHALYGVYAYINSSVNSQVVDIQYSRFIENTNGVRVYEGYALNGALPVISYNQFIDNEVNVYATHASNHDSSTVIDARFNWWNSIDIGEIMTKIHDHSDSTYGMYVNYGQYRGSTAIDDILTNAIAWSWPGSLTVNGETVLDGNYSIVGNTEIAADQVVRVTAGSHITIEAGVQFTVNLGGQWIVEEGASVTINDNAIVNVYGEWAINAGVIIQSGINARVNVYGRLIGNGLENNEIHFDSSLAAPGINSWNGITAYATATVHLRYTQISHALYGVYAYINSSTNSQVIDIQYSRFVENTNGVRILEGYENTGAVPILQYNQFIDNDLHMYATHSGSHVSSTVINARFNWWNTTDISEIIAKIYDYQDATYGMFINYGQFRGSAIIDDIIDNAIAWIWPDDLIVDGETVLDGDYSFIGNTDIVADQIVRVKAGSHITIGAGVKLTIALGGKLIIEDGASVTIDDGGGVDVYGEWEVGAGVTVTSGLNVRINVYGSLIGNGLEGSEIHFGSTLDSSLGNADGSATAGSWYGIHAHANANVSLRYTLVSHAQYGVYVDINHSINSQVIDIQYSRFIENTYGIHVYEGYSNTGSSLVLHYNQFISNHFHIHGSYSSNHSSTTVIDARFNWWNSIQVGEIISRIYDHTDATDGLIINYGQYLGSIDINDVIHNTIVWVWPEDLTIDGETVLDGDYTFIGNTHINTDQVVRVKAGSHITIGAGVHLTVSQAGRWIIEDGATVTIEDGAIINVYGEWHIGAGVTVRSGLNVQINIYGSLMGNGLEGNEIHFGSSLDIPDLGRWQGITVYSGATIQLVYTHVSHAEYGVYAHINSETAINVDIRYSRFIDNTNAVRVYEFIQNTSSTFVLEYNQFINNTFNIYAYSAYLNSLLQIEANFNWWNTVVIEDIAAKIFDRSHGEYGLVVDHEHDRFGEDIDEIDYVYGTVIIDIDIIVKRRIRIIGETTIGSGHSVTIGAGASLTIDAGSTLHVDGDLILEEGAELIVDGAATIDVTGRVIVNGSTLTLPTDLTVNLRAGSRFYASIDTTVHVHGHFNSQGSSDNFVYIGVREEDRERGFWQGLTAHIDSKVVIKYTYISHARVGVYAWGSSDVNITYSWLMDNIRAVHLYFDQLISHEHNSVANFVAHYNRFERNTKYNIYAEQAVAGYFNGRVSVEYNWWGSVDISVINQLFFGRGDDIDLGLWLDFSYIWLDTLGENTWHNGFAGSIDVISSYNEDISFIGYSEINADVTMNAGARLIVDASATLIANAHVIISETAKVVVRDNGFFKVNDGVSLTLNPDTDLQLGIGATVEVIGEVIVRAAIGQSIFFRGAEAQDPLVCPADADVDALI